MARKSIYIILLWQMVCFLTKGETVYENKNYHLSGKGGSTTSIVVKVDYYPEQDNYILTIGNPGGIFNLDGNEKALWIFNREIDAKSFCKKQSNLSCKKFSTLLPFVNESNADFSLSKEKKITGQQALPFKLTNNKGQAKIDLKLRVYVATMLKTEIIEEEAFINIISQLSSNEISPTGGSGTGSSGGGSGGGGAGGPEAPAGGSEKTPAEIEIARRDSIKRLVNEWENYFIGKNVQIGQLIQSINQIDSTTVTEAKIDSFIAIVKKLKNTVDLQFQKRELLENNNSLTEKFIDFNSTCDLALEKLGEWKVELQKAPPPEEEINWLLIIGIGFGVLMLALPIVTQAAGSRKVKKMQKKQNEEARKQAEEAEKARLLADEDSAI